MTFKKTWGDTSFELKYYWANHARHVVFETIERMARSIVRNFVDVKKPDLIVLGSIILHPITLPGYEHNDSGNVKNKKVIVDGEVIQIGDGVNTTAIGWRPSPGQLSPEQIVKTTQDTIRQIMEVVMPRLVKVQGYLNCKILVMAAEPIVESSGNTFDKNRNEAIEMYNEKMREVVSGYKKHGIYRVGLMAYLS